MYFSGVWNVRSAEIVKLSKDVARGRSLIERAAHTQRAWNEMQAGALPKDAAQAEQELITAFDRWGRENRIELGSIKPQWKRGTTRYSTLECRVDATGDALDDGEARHAQREVGCRRRQRGRGLALHEGPDAESEARHGGARGEGDGGALHG